MWVYGFGYKERAEGFLKTKEIIAYMSRITSAFDGTWARNFPGGGHSGPSITALTFEHFFASVYETFRIGKTPFGNTFTIQNIGSRLYACPFELLDNRIMGRDDIPPTRWAIEDAGEGFFVIKLPNRDSVWTLKDGDVFLEPANGGLEQRFYVQRPE